jgi:hypothetical protein
MTTSCGNHMHGYASVEQGCFMTSAQIMEAQFGETLTGLSLKFARNRIRVSEFGEVEPMPGETWKHQGVHRRPHKR